MAHPQPALSSREVARRKMIAFYARYLPEKLPQVDSILDQYPGSEHKVIHAMQIKYPEWNFSYVPPDLSGMISQNLSQQSVPRPASPPSSPLSHGSPGRLVQALHPQSIPVSPGPLHQPAYLQAPYMSPRSTYSPVPFTDPQSAATMPPSHPVQPTVHVSPSPIRAHTPLHPGQQLPTKEELAQVVEHLQEKLLQQQKREMAGLEDKLQKIMSLTEMEKQREVKREKEKMDDQQRKYEEGMRQLLQQQQNLERVRSESERRQQQLQDEKSKEIEAVRMQLDYIMKCLQNPPPPPPPPPAPHPPIPDPTLVHQQQQLDESLRKHQELLRDSLRELEMLREKEARRMQQDYHNVVEMDKLREENRQLRGEGQEGRELMKELQGIISQLKTSNESKNAEIEALLQTTQGLKMHYDALQLQNNELHTMYGSEMNRTIEGHEEEIRRLERELRDKGTSQEAAVLQQREQEYLLWANTEMAKAMATQYRILQEAVLHLLANKPQGSYPPEHMRPYSPSPYYDAHAAFTATSPAPLPPQQPPPPTAQPYYPPTSYPTIPAYPAPHITTPLPTHSTQPWGVPQDASQAGYRAAAAPPPYPQYPQYPQYSSPTNPPVPAKPSSNPGVSPPRRTGAAMPSVPDLMESLQRRAQALQQSGWNYS